MERRKRRIVLVDDSPITLELAAAALALAGFDVQTAESIFDVSRVVEEHQPDLLVLDVVMPALRGDQVISVLRRQVNLGCPVLLHSSMPEEALRACASACGADGFLRKSTDATALVRAVTRLLAPGGAHGK